MRRRRATVATPGEWQCKTARSGEWAQHISNASCLTKLHLCNLSWKHAFNVFSATFSMSRLCYEYDVRPSVHSICLSVCNVGGLWSHIVQQKVEMSTWQDRSMSSGVFILPQGGVWSIVILFVCLSVCLSVHSHNSKTTWPNFMKFLCMLRVVRFFSGLYLEFSVRSYRYNEILCL